MRLYLVRHATAVPRGTAGFSDDASRPLTDEGRAETRRAAQVLRRMNIAMNVIASSPYVRAMQTAEGLARGLGFAKPVREMDAMRAEAEPTKTSHALLTFAGYDHVALVGHEPHLSAWLAELVAKDGMQCVMKKGGMACVEISRVPPATGSGTLRWLLTSKQIGLMADRAA